MISVNRRVHHGNSKPLYLQLRDILVDMIDNGELTAGDALPGERTLAEMYDLSRVTVRKCIGNMVDDGYLIRNQGKETIVAKRKVNHHLGLLVGVAEELAENEYKVKVEAIETKFEKASFGVAKNLQVEQNELVFKFSRVIYKDDNPLILNYSYVPYDIGKIIEPLDFNTDKVFTYLEKYGYKLSYGNQLISAGLCKQAEKEYLDYEVGKPVLVISRTTYTDNGYPVLYEKSIYRGDEYQYSIRLQRKI